MVAAPLDRDPRARPVSTTLFQTLVVLVHVELQHGELRCFSCHDPGALGADAAVNYRSGDFADAVLDASLMRLHTWQAVSLGEPTDSDGRRQSMVIIAMGKLGGREIGYGSDLDVIFLYDPAAAPDDPETAAACAASISPSTSTSATCWRRWRR